MSPTQTTVPNNAPPAVDSVSGQPNSQLNPATAGTLTPNIVANFPVHNPGGASVPAPLNDDRELDKIMLDASKGLDKFGKKTNKTRFSFFNHKSKKEAIFHAQPIEKTQPMAQPPMLPPKAAPTPPPPPRPVASPVPRPPQSAHQQPHPVKPGPLEATKKSSAPVLVIVMTFLVTSALIAAAFFSYKNG
jgi:hypothetical protein